MSTAVASQVDPLTPGASVCGRPSESRWIDLGDGRRLHVRCWTGVGTPIVLLHGLLDSWQGWAEVCDAIERPCVAFDLPGFGASDLPTLPRITAYAQDIAAGIHALGLDDFVLVGHSLGGAVATGVAELVGDAVAALVLLAPAGFGRILLAELTSLPLLRGGVKRGLSWTLSRSLPVSLAYRAFVSNGAPAADGVIERLTATGPTLVASAVVATDAVIAAGQDDDAFHRRRVAYSGPVTAVWGAADRVVPATHRRGVQTALPQASVVLWEGMGHHPQRERFTELIDVVLDSLQPRVEQTRSTARHLKAASGPSLATARAAA